MAVVAGIFGPNTIHEALIRVLAIIGVVEIVYTIYLLRKPLVVTISDEEPMSEHEPVPVIKPA